MHGPKNKYHTQWMVLETLNWFLPIFVIGLGCIRNFVHQFDVGYVGKALVFVYYTVGFLDRRSTHWDIESTVIGGESYST